MDRFTPAPGRQPDQGVRDDAAELRRYADIVPAMIVSYDENLICRFANSQYAAFFGFTAENILGLHARQILGEELFASVERHVDDALRGRPSTYQRAGRGTAGTGRELEVKLWPNVGASGECRGFFGVTTDITEIRHAERALRESAEQLRVFADSVPAMAISYDNKLRCRFANKRFAEYFGFTIESIVGKHLSDVVGETAFREIESYFDRVLAGHPSTYQRVRKLDDGQVQHLEVKLMPQFGDDATVVGLFAVTTDITEHKHAEERIQRLAHYDGLTGLPNRLLYADRLAQAINAARRNTAQLALLYLDLDKFKPVNDSWGHDVGDELLKAVAVRIQKQVRASDTVARIGGDEFAVILAAIRQSDAAASVAAKIVEALGRVFRLAGKKVEAQIGISVGIAMYPADGEDVDALTRNADAAMYRAKQTGNCYCLARKR